MHTPLAEGEGFEPSIQETCIPDFESGAFDHSATFRRVVVLCAFAARSCEARDSSGSGPQQLQPRRPCTGAALPEPRRCRRPAGSSRAPRPACGPTARPEPLSVCTSSVLPCALRKRACMRRAWNASQFEHERDLAVGVLRRQPDLEVVGLRRTEAHVAGAQQRRRGTAARAAAGSPRRGRPSPRARRSERSGCANCTISTLSNWCWRIMPRVSLP